MSRTEASTGVGVCSRCGELAGFVGRLRASKLLLGSLLAAFALAALLPAGARADISVTGAWGWGVSDGMSQFEACISTCQTGLQGSGAGQLGQPNAVATDSSGDVYATDYNNNRVDEFSSTGSFTRAWGWGVSDGASHFETCTSTCQIGIHGGGAGQLSTPRGVATDGSGDVYVADAVNSRIDEFSSTGSFTRAWGWGVSDGASHLETCTSACQTGIPAYGAGALHNPDGVATDPSGDVYVADNGSQRIDEFSSTGSFTRGWGWGVSDGASHFETCTSTCQNGLAGSGAGQLEYPEGVATDSSGDVYVADSYDHRIDEFSSTGSFTRAWGWGVSDGASHFETCTSACQIGIPAYGAGALENPDGVATDGSGDVYVANLGNRRIDEFSSTGSFTRAWAWGVSDGASHFETCISTCQNGLAGSGAGQVGDPEGVATDPSGDVYVADRTNNRIDEFAQSLPPQLTVSKSGTGAGTVTSLPAGIDCGSTCSATFNEGTVVTLTASAVTGSTFAGWTGAGCLGTGACQVTMSQDQSVTATFTAVPPPQYSLTVSKSGSGSGTVTSSPAGIDCGATCSASYVQGAVVMLTATAASGSTFTGWSGACSGTGSCVVATNTPRSVTATFSLAPKPKPCLVPTLKGKGLKAARRALKAHSCSLGKVTYSFSTQVKQGRVIFQKPKPGKRLKHGAKVNLVLSRGKH